MVTIQGRPRAGMPRNRTVVILCIVVVTGLYGAAYYLPFSVSNGSTTFSFGDTDSNNTAAPFSEDVDAFVAGEYADQLGLGELTPMCGDLPKLRAGVTFTCTATTVDGQVIELDGGFVESKGTYIEATNVVAALAIEESLFDSYTDGYPDDGLAPEGVDCGDGFVVLDDGRLECALDGWRWEPETAKVTVNSIDPLQFTWVIE